LWLENPLVNNARNLDRSFHLYVLGVFEVCLELLPSDFKEQFGFVVGEFSVLIVSVGRSA